MTETIAVKFEHCCAIRIRINDINCIYMKAPDHISNSNSVEPSKIVQVTESSCYTSFYKNIKFAKQTTKQTSKQQQNKFS